MSMTRRNLILRGAAGLLAAGQSWKLARAQDASIPNATIDLSAPTGKLLGKQLYGYSTGALFLNGFAPAADSTVQASAEFLDAPLLRFNTPASGVNDSYQTLFQVVFANGVENPDWSPLRNWVNNRQAFLGSEGNLVFGIGPGGGDTSLSPSVWASYATATARYFRSIIGQEVMYWEVGNECDGMGAHTYSTYFNAIADALHAVNRKYLVGGPVGSWFNGIELVQIVKYSGASRIGFIDFHSYAVASTDSLETAYSKAATFGDVASAPGHCQHCGSSPADRPAGIQHEWRTATGWKLRAAHPGNRSGSGICRSSPDPGFHERSELRHGRNLGSRVR